MVPQWLIGLLAAGGVLLLGCAVGLLWRRGTGRVRETAPPEGSPHAELLTALGVREGAPATLLQFSSAFCAPCRATRRICAEVAEMLDGVRHVEVDAEQNLDAVRALGVLRTPTVLVVDARHRVVRRASGQPTTPHLIAAVAPLLGPGHDPHQ